MHVIGIVGLPGSGKSEAASVAEELGVPVVTMGDVVRAACRDRGLDVTEANLGRVATALRESGGDAAIAERSLPLVREALDDADRVVIDGIRSGVEVDRFEEAFGEDFLLISVEAPFESRLERVRDRGRDATAEDRADLRERDERERGYGMDDAMADADVVVENADTLGAFRDRIRTLIVDGPEAVER